MYGRTKISIDYDDPNLCRRRASLTLEDLEANGADVVILDYVTLTKFSRSEVDAIQAYAKQGHNLVGTFLTFKWSTIDNSALAPLFGLVEDAAWTGGYKRITPEFTLETEERFAKPLVRRLPNPYVSSGLDSSQRPGDLRWSRDELDGAKYVGRNANKSAAITVYRAADYNAVYISSWPTYGGLDQDRQFFYNAIIYPRMR